MSTKTNTTAAKSAAETTEAGPRVVKAGGSKGEAIVALLKEKPEMTRTELANEVGATTGRVGEVVRYLANYGDKEQKAIIKAHTDAQEAARKAKADKRAEEAATKKAEREKAAAERKAQREAEAAEKKATAEKAKAEKATADKAKAGPTSTPANGGAKQSTKKG